MPAQGRCAGEYMRIALLGQFGSGNSGNDGSLEAMIRFLRDAVPEAEVVGVCPAPEAISRRYGIPATGIGSSPAAGGITDRLNRILRGVPHRLGNLVEALRRTRGFDWLVVPGTGILDDYRDNPFGWPFVLLRWCLAARINGARIAFVSVGAGPIRHPLSRHFLKAAAGLAGYRSYRDQVSRDFIESIGLDVSRDPVVADIVFALTLPERTHRRSSSRLRVGLGVMSYRGWSKKDEHGDAIYQAYLDRLARFAAWLLEQDHDVRLLTGDRDDWTAVEDLRARLASMGCDRHRDIVAEPAFSLGDLTRQMGTTDAVVASRYHNVVCALKLGLPTISLSYAEKNDALLAECGLEEFCQHVETFDVGRLTEQFDRLIDTQATRAIGIRVAVAKMVERLKRQEEALSDLFSPDRNRR